MCGTLARTPPYLSLFSVPTYAHSCYLIHPISHYSVTLPLSHSHAHNSLSLFLSLSLAHSLTQSVSFALSLSLQYLEEAPSSPGRYRLYDGIIEHTVALGSFHEHGYLFATDGLVSEAPYRLLSEVERSLLDDGS